MCKTRRCRGPPLGPNRPHKARTRPIIYTDTAIGPHQQAPSVNLFMVCLPTLLYIMYSTLLNIKIKVSYNTQFSVVLNCKYAQCTYNILNGKCAQFSILICKCAQFSILNCKYAQCTYIPTIEVFNCK